VGDRVGPTLARTHPGHRVGISSRMHLRLPGHPIVIEELRVACGQEPSGTRPSQGSRRHVAPVNHRSGGPRVPGDPRHPGRSPALCAVRPCVETRYKRAHLSAIRLEGPAAQDRSYDPVLVTGAHAIGSWPGAGPAGFDAVRTSSGADGDTRGGSPAPRSRLDCPHQARAVGEAGAPAVPAAPLPETSEHP